MSSDGRRRRVLVTGANGFIGRNLVVHLRSVSEWEVLTFTRGDSDESLARSVESADAIIHLAGENRPKTESDFEAVNGGLTRRICEMVATRHSRGRASPRFLLASSRQAALDNPYGRSKVSGEDAVRRTFTEVGGSAFIWRLPGVFGKWSRPNYNSVVATYCHNISRGLPITVRDPSAVVDLVYVDDVISSFCRALTDRRTGVSDAAVEPVYSVSLGDLAAQIQQFNESRRNLGVGRVGHGFTRALHATFLSFLPPEEFCYAVASHVDARGAFVEMLRTPDSGQVSYFTALPGVVRGGHYHHTKSERFLVVRGTAKFRFRNVVSGEYHELIASGAEPTIVETVPGWAHDVVNVGTDELVALLWANEIFDREKPDTFFHQVADAAS